jgi:hypothetical protein
MPRWREPAGPGAALQRAVDLIDVLDGPSAEPGRRVVGGVPGRDQAVDCLSQIVRDLLDDGKGDSVVGVGSFVTNPACLRESFYQRIDTQLAWLDEQIQKYDPGGPAPVSDGGISDGAPATAPDAGPQADARETDLAPPAKPPAVDARPRDTVPPPAMDPDPEPPPPAARTPDGSGCAYATGAGGAGGTGTGVLLLVLARIGRRPTRRGPRPLTTAAPRGGSPPDPR